MALPSYTDIISTPEFKELDGTKQRELTDRYWSEFEADTGATDFVNRQREAADQLFTARGKMEGATPLQQRFLDRQLDRSAFTLRLNEGVQSGILSDEDAAAELERYTSENSDRDAKLEKTASLFDPKVQEEMAPTFGALRDLALRGGQFGSPALDARISDFLPGGEKNVVQGSKEAYAALRKQVATDFNLGEEEVEDVIRHQLDMQPEQVSRDAFGTPYIKSEILAQGEEATAAAINNSTLPWSEKKRLLDGLPEKLDAFKGTVLEGVKKSSPDLAARLELDGADNATGFQRLSETLNDTRSEQFAGGFAAGLAGTEALLEPVDRFFRGTAGSGNFRANTGYSADANRDRLETINQLSSEFNKSRTQIFGTDAAAFGLGAESVAEAVGTGLLTGGSSAPFSAARISTMGKVGQALAGGLNRAVAVAPIAGLGAAKSAMSTYDSALEAGLPEEEASKLAWRSGLIEFGVTSGMSTLGLGGVEDVGGQLTRAGARNAIREGARKALDSFGGKTVKGIVGEQFEENLITALDSTLVQTKINPNMTVDDFTQQLKDTALVTLGVSGPASAIGAYAETREKPTYEQTTEQLEVTANLALAEAEESGEANSLPTGPDAADALSNSDLASDGAPSDLPVGSDSTVPELGDVAEPGVSDAALETETPATDDSIGRDGGGELDVLATESPIEAEHAVEPSEPDASGTESVATRTESPAPDVDTSPLPTPNPETNEIEEGQRQGRPEVLTPEDDLTDSEVIPETSSDAGTEVVENDAPESEVSKTEEDEDYVALRNAYVDQQREELGLPKRRIPETLGNETALREAAKKVKRDKEAPAKLVESVRKKPRALTPVENALMLRRQIDLEQSVRNSAEELEKADDGNRIDRLVELEAAEAALVDFYNVQQATGTEAGRSLQARKLAAREDYSLVRLNALTQENANKGAPLTPEQRKTNERISRELEVARRKITELEVALASGKGSRGGAVQSRLEKDIETAQTKLATKEKRARLREKLDAQANAARERIRMRGEESRNAGVRPEDLSDLAIIAAAEFRNGIISVQELVEKLVSQFGESVRKYGNQLHEEAKRAYLEAANDVGNVKTPDDVLATLTPGETPSKRDIYNLAKAHIIDGKRGEAVLDATTSDLQTIVPGIDRATVAEIFTDYGKTIYPSQEEVAVQLRNVRAAEQVALKLKDVLAGKPPKRTGYQRGDTDPEVRKLQKELNAKMREAGIKVTSPAQQIKSSLDAIKSRLRNEIEDRRKAIEDRKPLPKGGDPVAYDAEAKVLRDELETVRKEYDEVFAKPGLTPKQQLAQATKSLTRRIAAEEKLLAEGLTSRSRDPKMSAWSPELVALQQRLDTLVNQRAEARRALRPRQDPRTQAIKALQRQITRYKDLLDGKIATPKKSAEFRPNNEYLALIYQRSQLQEALASMRKDEAPARPSKSERQEQATIKALAKSIAEIDNRIRNKDFAPRAKAEGPESPLVTQMRENRKRLETIYRELQKSERPPLTDDEILQKKINRIVKASEKRSEKLADKIARKDFTKPPKPDPVTAKAIDDARLKEFQLKREFNEGLLKAQLENRTKAEKLRDHVIDGTTILGRAIQTSFDLGHFGRQGGLVNFARPDIAAKNIQSLFSFSEKAADRAQLKLEGRTETEKALFKRAKDAGLGLTEWRPGYELNDMEEAFRSRIAKKIPGVGASERAYVSYMNAIRFDYFNALAGAAGDKSPAALKELANHVNNMTGRGSLDFGRLKMENAAGFLAQILFSPKYWSSRLRIAANAFGAVPMDLVTGFKLRRPEIREARKLIAKEYVRMAIGGTAFYSLVGLAAYMAKALADDKDEKPLFTVGTDPTSSDFGKLVFRNGSRQDPMAGMSQNLVFLTRMLGGKSTSISGRVTDLDEDPRASRGQVALRMVRSKLAPLPGAITNVLSKSDMGFKPTRWEKELVGLYMPISLTETINGFRELGVTGGLVSAISGFFGGGVNTYGQGVEDKDIREDLFTGLYWATDGKYGFPKSRYEPQKKGGAGPRVPKPPSPPKPPG